MATGGLKHFSGEVVEEKFLTCSICLQKFKTPKLLPCLHTFCLKCLKGHVDRSARNGSFPCPNCRQPTDVPSNTDTGFKTNFFMNSLLDFFSDSDDGPTCSFCSSSGKAEKAVSKCIDCSDYLCEKCTEVHGMTRQTVKHKVISIDQLVRGGVDEEASAKAGFPCSEHPEENVRYYCTVCEKPVCRDCKALDHHQHHCTAFHEAAKERRPKMKESLAFLKDQLENAKVMKHSAHEDKEKGKKCSERHIQEIETIFNETVMHLKSLKKEAINQINEQNTTFCKQMTTEEEDADKRYKQIKSFREYLTNVLNIGTDVEILETYSLARKQNFGPEQAFNKKVHLHHPYTSYGQFQDHHCRPGLFGFQPVVGNRFPEGSGKALKAFTAAMNKRLLDFINAGLNYMSAQRQKVMNKPIFRQQSPH